MKIKGVIKSAILYAFPIMALILSLYAKETSEAARNALYMCLDVVIPSLFPFFVLSRMILPFISSFSCPKFLKHFVERFFRMPYYTLIVIILGYLSGYPTGAKLSRDMFDEGLINSRQASRLITVSNNCSPLFIMGTIGAGLFKSIKTGFVILIIHWISGLIAAVLSGQSKDLKTADSNIKNNTLHYKPKDKINDKKTLRFSQLFPSAIEEAAILSVKVTGYIVFFAVLSELLAQLGFFRLISSMVSLLLAKNSPRGSLQDIVSAMIKGFIEIASGSKAVSQIHDVSISIKLAVISLICGFAGFSVHTQVMGIMKGTRARYSSFISGKLLHGLLAAIITFAVIELLPMTIQASTLSTFSSTNFSGMRVFTITAIILSLFASPYKSKMKKYTVKN